MTTATLRLSTPLAQPATAAKQSLPSRIYQAVMAARMRQAVREIAMHRHLLPEELLQQADLRATVTNDGALPFTR